MTIQEVAQAKVGDTIKRVMETVETVETVRDGSLLVTIETVTKERVERTLGGKTEQVMIGARMTQEKMIYPKARKRARRACRGLVGDFRKQPKG